MYLKSIEIQGFKSFANKLLFEFHDGITAIVGPNGSGKSNVADAVRWVLGEQSAKQLRGTKMEDIIFSGTESRKPLGFAYVAITLDNSDHQLSTSYEEVTVARRVYRSGESEYLINGSSCRLKDIQELFLDTGIGKEGYSIIGQGQIDKILSGKPEDRRDLFDEAAGIVKFKKRKFAAEKNLEEEKQNLYRINDILAEVEKQIAPLEKQSVVAKEYLKLRDELKYFDVNLFLLEYDKIHSEFDELDKKLVIAEGDLENTKNTYENTKAEYEKLELQIEIYNNELEEKKSDLSESKVKKEQLEGEVKVLNEQINASKQNDAHYKERSQAITKELDDKNKELSEYVSKKQEIDQQIRVLLDVKLEAEEKLSKVLEEIEAHNRDIEQSKKAIIDYLNENANIKSQLQRYEILLEQNNIKKVSLNQKLIKNKSEEINFNEKIKHGKNILLEVADQLQHIENINGELEDEIITIDKNMFQCRKEFDQKQQEFHREQSKLDSLKNITERYEGYGQSIRRIMEQKDKVPGIMGVVADIIKVEEKYETAIETALGGTIQNIVTDNDITAKQLIEFLKKNKYGRATFLPLTSIGSKSSFQNVAALKEKGVIGLASQLVNADGRYQGLLEYLLGRIVVVDHIDNGLLIAKKYHHSLKIVTTDGELLNPGGSMSGGAYKNSSNLLSRRREMEDLEKLIEEIEQKKSQLNKTISVLKDDKHVHQEAVLENKAVMQSLFLKQNTEKIKYDQAVSEKEENQSELLQISTENSKLEKQIKEVQEEISNLNQKLKDNEMNNQQNQENAGKSSIQLENMKAEEQAQREKVSEIKLTFSSLEQSNQFLSENQKRVQEEIQRLTIQFHELERNIANAYSQITEKIKNIEHVKLQIENYNVLIYNAEEEIRNIHSLKEEISKSHKDFFHRREELSNRINALDKECFRLTSQKEKISEQLDNQINYMWEEYELTYHSALELKSESTNGLTFMKKSIQEVKNKIKNLGDINVNAIDDYKNLMERYELLKTQHDDLVKAEDILRGIIDELDEEMRKQFEEKFVAIKNQFDLVFKELFGGGKGTLELSEDADILEAGIRIIAQPPGKKLQNMMQLSGGEKALTAISLLFAIQNLKPSPFCLLDEIEAALDDSNVKRYAKYLHKLTKHTQFIVITHRQGTMAAADILYGITMQEKGVSTLVSVNLIENELDK